MGNEINFELMLSLQSWAKCSKIFMDWLCSLPVTQKMALSLKCMQENEPPCFPPQGLTYIGGNYLSTQVLPHPPLCFMWLIMDTLQQEANLLRVKVSFRQVQGSWSSNSFVTRTGECVLYSVVLWCAKLTWADQSEISILKLLRISSFFSKA